MIASCCPDAKVFDNTEVMYSFISHSFSEFIRLYHSRTDTNETGGYVYTLLVLDLKTLVNCFEMNLVPCACKQTDTTLNNKTSRGGRIENCRLFTRDPVMGRRNILGTSSHLGPSFSVVTTPTTNLKFWSIGRLPCCQWKEGKVMTICLEETLVERQRKFNSLLYHSWVKTLRYGTNSLLPCKFGTFEERAQTLNERLLVLSRSRWPKEEEH